MEPEQHEGPQPPRHRVDWRTGKAMVERGDAFWQEHERQRLATGMSVPQYCVAHELALYRHRVSVRRRGVNTAATATASGTTIGATARKAASFVALSAPVASKAAATAAQGNESLEVSLGGMTLRLQGEAAVRVLERVMARLA